MPPNGTSEQPFLQYLRPLRKPVIAPAASRNRPAIPAAIPPRSSSARAAPTPAQARLTAATRTFAHAPEDAVIPGAPCSAAHRRTQSNPNPMAAPRSTPASVCAQIPSPIPATFPAATPASPLLAASGPQLHSRTAETPADSPPDSSPKATTPSPVHPTDRPT